MLKFLTRQAAQVPVLSYRYWREDERQLQPQRCSMHRWMPS